MQDRLMDEVREELAQIEDRLEQHRKRRSSPSRDAEAAERRRTSGNKRYTPPRTR